MHTCPALRPRWCPARLPWREQDCCLPLAAQRRLWVRLPGLILWSTTIHFSEFNDTAYVLAFPLLRTPPLSDRPSVRLLTRWLALGQVGLDRFRSLTHWVTSTSFKSRQLSSNVPDLSRHKQHACSAAGIGTEEKHQTPRTPKAFHPSAQGWRDEGAPTLGSLPHIPPNPNGVPSAPICRP